MIIDMRTVAEGHSTLTGTTELESVRDDLPSVIDNVVYNAEIDRTGPTAFVYVTFRGTFEMECSRCLGNYPLVINGEFRAIVKEKSAQADNVAADDDLEFFYNIHDGQVDISSAFFDEIMIAIPLMPLCSETCKGIEIDGLTGVNTSQQQGSTEEKPIDPRWEALKKLKTKN